MISYFREFFGELIEPFPESPYHGFIEDRLNILRGPQDRILSFGHGRLRSFDQIQLFRRYAVAESVFKVVGKTFEARFRFVSAEECWI